MTSRITGLYLLLVSFQLFQYFSVSKGELVVHPTQKEAAPSFPIVVDRNGREIVQYPDYGPVQLPPSVNSFAGFLSYGLLFVFSAVSTALVLTFVSISAAKYSS